MSLSSYHEQLEITWREWFTALLNYLMSSKFCMKGRRVEEGQTEQNTRGSHLHFLACCCITQCFLFDTIVENWQKSTRRARLWPMPEHISCFVSQEQHITLWATALTLCFLSVNKCVVLVCPVYVHACKCVDPCMVLQVSPQAFLQLKIIFCTPLLQTTGTAS